MRGRWAAGIVPRNFAWIVKDRLAVSERPGGYAPHHRRVRRQEEIIWLEAQGFTRVVSLLPSPHNLHAYEELGLPASHFGLSPHGDVRAVLADLYPAMLEWTAAGERVLVHQDELGERVAGVVAGFLCWCGLLPDPPRAIYAVEQLLRRQMGSTGRAIVALAPSLPPPTISAPLGATPQPAPRPSPPPPTTPPVPTTPPPPLATVPGLDGLEAGESSGAVNAARPRPRKRPSPTA